MQASLKPTSSVSSSGNKADLVQIDIENARKRNRCKKCKGAGSALASEFDIL